MSPAPPPTPAAFAAPSLRALAPEPRLKRLAAAAFNWWSEQDLCATFVRLGVRLGTKTHLTASRMDTDSEEVEAGVRSGRRIAADLMAEALAEWVADGLAASGVRVVPDPPAATRHPHAPFLVLRDPRDADLHGSRAPRLDLLPRPSVGPAALQAQSYPTGLLLTLNEGDPHGRVRETGRSFVGRTFSPRQAVRLALAILGEAKRHGWPLDPDAPTTPPPPPACPAGHGLLVVRSGGKRDYCPGCGRT